MCLDTYVRKLLFLFQTCHIFHEYDHFLIVVASAHEPPKPEEPSQAPIKWFGLIESKIRHLINSLEKEYRHQLAAARIWPKPFTKKAEKTNITRQLWFIGIKSHQDDNVKDFDYMK